ncbi:hypothetical protein COU14_01630 [Candidatus Kaiserbacteria bacterium CG10_big_fil_rev_8_21_14_0_10_44_10]|uniref:Uncharacterized protein n=1 Tax=Candidatus Kaiserbacteria bacterium CG10_big_fil_rev_8_21_14_0_10_44_10 TaxID=1974606 RepID=A0A2H0UHS8_9BACT|nr:MAG: hypothetical protein COU14_01630 [Candidatus Kaiserbacteria bacterium CG10_big_fil_rev_8_21_14_0_10_44_10]
MTGSPKRCTLPQEVCREWGLETSLTQIRLCGREGDIHPQIYRIMKTGRKLGAKITHIICPPAEDNQPGWRQVTEEFSSRGTMTFAEGGVLPGIGHCVCIPIRLSFILYVENWKNGRVGVARIRKESLSNPCGCCPPDSVVQSLFHKLEVLDGNCVRAYIVGTGDTSLSEDILCQLERWGVIRQNVTSLSLNPNQEIGLSNLRSITPEQDWVFVYQHRLRT